MTFQRPSNSNRTFPTPVPTRLPTGFQVLPTRFQRRASNPPYPPALEAPNAAGSRLGVPAAQGREGQKTADHRDVCSNSQLPRHSIALGRVYPLIPSRTDQERNCYDPVVPRSGERYPLRQGGEEYRQSLKTRGFAASCPTHVQYLPFGKGFSRALSHELQHSWKPMRSPGGSAVEREISMAGHEKTGRGWGWGKSCALSWISCPRSLSRPARKIPERL
ncbi:hypothetical protein GGD61_002879 [Bradyrhizobium sp. SBR1B]|nr:hypothetical protein [Bradyrhizobium sp. SBR1B]